MSCIAVGICGIITKTRGGVITTIILGSVAMVTAVAGAIIDSYRLSELSGLLTCVQVEAGAKLPGYSAETLDCKVLYTALDRKSNVHEYFCSITGKSHVYCKIYQPNGKYTCDDVRVTLPSVFKSSTAICSVIVRCSIVLAAVGCSIVCCTGTAKKETATKPEELPDNVLIGVNSNPKAY